MTPRALRRSHVGVDLIQTRLSSQLLTLPVLLLTLAGCGSRPLCPDNTARPGWDDAAQAPRPLRAASTGAPTPLGCPALPGGKPALEGNLRPPATPPKSWIEGFTSPDLRTWTPLPGRAPHAFTSLGLYVEGQSLYLLGNNHLPAPIPGTMLTGLRTTDLAHWQGCAWAVCGETAPQPLDAELVRLADGRRRAVYYPAEHTGGPGQDPALDRRIHPIALADGPGDRFQARGLIFGDTGLTDPSLAYFQGQWYLAATQAHRAVVLATSSDGEHFVRSGPPLTGVTVPSFYVAGEELWMVAQRYVNETWPGPWPVLLASRDGKIWEDRGFLLKGQPQVGCTSPVLGRFREQWVLFCAAVQREKRPGGGPAPVMPF